MTMLIGIAGKAGAGKDTVADHLFWQHGFVKMAFADNLRCAANAIFGIPMGAMRDRETKEAVDPYWGMSPRRILQLLGNDALKPVFGEDLWVKRWRMGYDLVKDTDDVVVSDVRFDLEAKAIRELGGHIVHLERPGAGLIGEAGAHASEAGVVAVAGDIFLHNDGNIAQLYDKIDALVRNLDAG